MPPKPPPEERAFNKERHGAPLTRVKRKRGGNRGRRSRALRREEQAIRNEEEAARVLSEIQKLAEQRRRNTWTEPGHKDLADAQALKLIKLYDEYRAERPDEGSPFGGHSASYVNAPGLSRPWRGDGAPGGDDLPKSEPHITRWEQS